LKFLAALQFLTSIPLPLRRESTPEELGHSTSYFPAVGLIIGLGLAGLNWLLSLILASAVVNALLIVFLVVITGALHLDGFVDTCDGLAGHRTVEDRWRVMHDSRAGAFGIISVVLLLLVKYVSLNSIPGPAMTATLIFMPVVSRWAIVYAIFACPYARPAGLGKVFKQGVSWRSFTVATLITSAVAIAIIPSLPLTGLAIMVGVWVITVVMVAYLKRKFSGLTGDNYGAVNEVAEVSVLILAVVLGQLGLA
jgi:adenosylcobinamide-GDP ribazoletransferase